MKTAFLPHDAIASLPISEAIDLYEVIRAKGIDHPQALREVAELVDRLVDWEDILGPQIGAAVELIDRPLLLAVLRLAVASRRKSS